jgi:hypothetical protein
VREGRESLRIEEVPGRLAILANLSYRFMSLRAQWRLPLDSSLSRSAGKNLRLLFFRRCRRLVVERTEKREL